MTLSGTLFKVAIAGAAGWGIYRIMYPQTKSDVLLRKAVHEATSDVKTKETKTH